MPIDETMLARARKESRSAMEGVLEQVYAAVSRMAHGLCGREEPARQVVRVVMGQGLKQLPRWRDAEAAERWFYHHTVLTARQAGGRPVKTADDLLVKQAGAADGAYVAFIRALRELPVQQREAFVLHHGEGFTTRHLGIAMDCSSKAAEMHLESATATLRPMAGEAFEAMCQRMRRAYQQLTPDEQVMVPAIRRHVRQTVWPRRVRRLVRLVLVLTVVGAAGYAAWKWEVWNWGR